MRTRIAIIVSVLLGLMSPGVVRAADFGTANTVRLSTGAGLGDREDLMLHVSVDYEHTWPLGFGFGVNAVGDLFSMNGNDQIYTGGSFVYSHCFENKLQLSGAVGMGFATSDLHDLGAGSLQMFNVGYRFNPNWAVIGQMKLLYTSITSMHMNISVGVEYHF